MIIALESVRETYAANESAARSLSVHELIELLGQFDDDDKVIFSNDNGYTYGPIRWSSATEIETEEEVNE